MKIFAITLLLLGVNCPGLVFAGNSNEFSEHVTADCEAPENLMIETTNKYLAETLRGVVESQHTAEKKIELLADFEKKFNASLETIDLKAMNQADSLAYLLYEAFRGHKINDEMIGKIWERCWYPVSQLPEHQRFSPSTEWEERKDQAYSYAEDVLGLKSSEEITRALKDLIDSIGRKEHSEKIIVAVDNASESGKATIVGDDIYIDFSDSLIEAFDLVESFRKNTVSEDIDLSVHPVVKFSVLAQRIESSSPGGIKSRSDIASSLDQYLSKSETQSMLNKAKQILLNSRYARN